MTKPYIIGEIESGIPLSDSSSRGPVFLDLYRLEEMKTGGSRAYRMPEDGSDEDLVVLARRVRGAVSSIKRRHPERKYATRTRPENGRTVVRAWRIE